MVETDLRSTNEKPRCRYEMLLWDCKLDATFPQQMLSENSTLQYLHLSLINMTYEAASILAKALCKNSTLEVLNLTNIGLGLYIARPLEFTSMVEMLQTNVALKSLFLGCSPLVLGSDGVTWIAEALGSNQGLELLFLNNTECGDEGAASLVKMLRMNKTLK